MKRDLCIIFACRDREEKRRGVRMRRDGGGGQVEEEANLGTGPGSGNKEECGGLLLSSEDEVESGLGLFMGGGVAKSVLNPFRNFFNPGKGSIEWIKGIVNLWAVTS